MDHMLKGDAIDYRGVENYLTADDTMVILTLLHHPTVPPVAFKCSTHSYLQHILLEKILTEAGSMTF